LAIDAGASHIISVELDPMKDFKPLEVDSRLETYNILEAAVTSFTTLLRRAIERDIRRTVTWNRFLTSHPESMINPQGWRRKEPTAPQEQKEIVHLYRIAPETREIGTAEFAGHYQDGRCVMTVRDLLQRGVVDMKGRHIWRATLQTSPHPDTVRQEARAVK
jgi:hypothetical protein